MKYVRPYDLTTVGAPVWLISPQEEAGCSIRLVSDGGEASRCETPDVERYALILKGGARLVTAETETEAQVGDLIFIPAGVSATISGVAGAVWAAIDAPVDQPAAPDAKAAVIAVDQSRFEGQGFAYQSLIDRSCGAQTMRMNALQVEPGAGSPDYHIHAFAQIYLIQEGEMTIDIGCSRYIAGVNSLVFLPAGVVHRNFNASNGIERHISLLVPEPLENQIFDYAVTIHQKEAELLSTIPELMQ